MLTVTVYKVHNTL